MTAAAAAAAIDCFYYGTVSYQDAQASSQTDDAEQQCSGCDDAFSWLASYNP